MNYLTLAKAKPVIARVMGKSTSSSEVVDAINEAVERLMVRGDWVGTIHRYRICITEAKLTWPRQIHTIKKCNICDSPIPVANGWYEFAQVGPGTLHDDDDPGLVLEDMGTACTFDDIIGYYKKLYVVSDEAEDSDAELIVQGYDDSNQWIRTLVGGAWIDGEPIAIGVGGALSTNYWTNITRIIKPVTNGNVRLFERDVPTGVDKPIGIYEPDETHPSYRRSRIPSLDTHGGCGDDACPEDFPAVNVLAKLRFIPVANDNDWIQIGNLPAIKEMVMSIQKAEKNLWDEAEVYENRALRELGKELVDYEGEASLPKYDIQSPALFGAGNIEGVI
jgi:hypothetical protein